MKKEYLEKDIYIYISRTKAENYWWSKIRIMVWNNIIMEYQKINKFIRWYNKSSIWI